MRPVGVRHELLLYQGSSIAFDHVVQHTIDALKRIRRRMTEVAAINPVASVQAIPNPLLLEKAKLIRKKFKQVIRAS